MKEVTSIPEGTTAERNALVGVSTGFVFLNTDTNQFEVYNGSVFVAQTGSEVSSATSSSSASTIVKRDASGGTHLKNLYLDGATSGSVSVIASATTTSYSLTAGSSVTFELQSVGQTGDWPIVLRGSASGALNDGGPQYIYAERIS